MGVMISEEIQYANQKSRSYLSNAMLTVGWTARVVSPEAHSWQLNSTKFWTSPPLEPQPEHHGIFLNITALPSCVGLCHIRSHQQREPVTPDHSNCEIFKARRMRTKDLDTSSHLQLPSTSLMHQATALPWTGLTERSGRDD